MPERGRQIALLIACGVVGLFYLFAGGTKLAGLPMHVEHFAQWGYPDWFRLFVGAWEVTGAVLLLIPATSFYGAVGLGMAMVGATYTELFRGVPARALFPLTLFFILCAIAYARRATRASGSTAIAS